MPKGIKRSLSMGEELREMDRALLGSVRKNLSLIRKYAEASSEEERAILKEVLENHPLITPEKPSVEETPKPLTERERLIEKVAGRIPQLEDPDLRMLLDITRSMRQRTRPGNPAHPEVAE
jgi:hypothetical protein